ncbi:hypothetical protein [Alcanivorax sp. 24]|uniref:hypothetical protein n=1 Tax=Alcanivorax sp. 24 TaxID=2545266 RepID=UPI00196B3AC9|nr:hypothetical protein [Alcanivorax sp. 24]
MRVWMLGATVPVAKKVGAVGLAQTNVCDKVHTRTTKSPAPERRRQAAIGDGMAKRDSKMESRHHNLKTRQRRERHGYPDSLSLRVHCAFIWHIWDGLSGDFAASVNYHKLDRKNLETLIYTYLGDWISRQKQDLASGVDGSEERRAAAESLKKKLEQILEGKAPYDIFVRWKPIEQQSIGWDPDLNDGVRLNIRPFMTVGDAKKKALASCATNPTSNGPKTAVRMWSQRPGTKPSKVSASTITM